MARIGILALLIASLLGACSSPSAGATMSPSLGVSASPSAIVSPLPSTSAFPSEVAGLPVISVASADELLRSGKLDGQAVAVAGYFDQFTPSCPYPGRYIGPLEGWCRFVAFTDTRATAQLCQPEGSNGRSCSQPSGTNLSPFFMSETSGDPWSLLTGGATGEPAALVLIGHAGDARQWQCTAATQAVCAGAFVIDRIAWANGRDVPPVAPQVGNVQTGKAITPRMTLPQVAAATGVGDNLLTAAAVRAGDVASVDPRWNLAGDNTVWLVRSLDAAAGSGAAESRPETVWLVDDATGKVVDSHPLKLAADYRPARLWQMATVHGAGLLRGRRPRLLPRNGRRRHRRPRRHGARRRFGPGPIDDLRRGIHVLAPRPAGPRLLGHVLARAVQRRRRGRAPGRVLLAGHAPAARRRQAERGLPGRPGVHLRARALAVARLVGSDMSRRATGRYASLALLATIALAGCAFVPGATDPAAAHQRAQAVLSKWADAVAAAGANAKVTPVGELTGQVGDWEEAVGDNNKRALMAGMVAFANPLSDEAPPDGEVTWQDGTTTKVPLLAAQQAIVAIENTAEAPCSDCAMLLVTDARLTSGPSRPPEAPRPRRSGSLQCRAPRSS